MNSVLIIFWIAAATIVVIALAVIYSAVTDMESADFYKAEVDTDRE